VRLDINFFLPVGGFSVPDPGIESVISVVTAVLQFYDSGLSGAQLHCVCPLRQTLPGQCTSQYTNSLESILPDLRMTLSRSLCNVYGLDCTEYINMLLKDDQMFVHTSDSSKPNAFQMIPVMSCICFSWDVSSSIVF